MATQAYKGKVLCDGYDISNLARSAELDISMGPLDTTTLETDGWAEGIPGIKSSSLAADVLRKGELQAHQHLLDGVFGNPATPNNIAYAPEGADIGQDVYTFVSYQTEHNLGAPVNGVVGGQVTFTTNGRVSLGKVLFSHVGNTPFTGNL